MKNLLVSQLGKHNPIFLTPRTTETTMNTASETLVDITDLLFFTGEIHLQWLPPIGYQTGGPLDYKRFYAELYHPVELVNIRQVRERLAQPSNLTKIF